MRIQTSLLLLLLCVSMYGQSFVRELDDKLQAARVGLVSEFMERFNDYSQDHLRLLDLSRYHSRQDSLFLAAEAMMKAAEADSIQLCYADSMWIAVAQCQGKLNGKAVDFTLYLTTEKRGEDMFKWSIAKAEGDILDISPKASAAFIMPDDHETNFISLGRMSKEQPRNVHAFIRQQPAINKTLVFETLVAFGNLKIDYVKNLKFLFTQVPGYLFWVENIVRETYNSGWLVTSFQTVTDEEKTKIIKDIYEY